ncbi:MAG: hypothetical protein ACI8TP_002276 [Acidimicrobiales bacterium]|jgi:hypothetical protein
MLLSLPTDILRSRSGKQWRQRRLTPIYGILTPSLESEYTVSLDRAW